MKISVHCFVCHKLLFSINKENFRIFDKIPIFLRIFCSDLVGFIDILIATDIANTLSLSKRCCTYLFCPHVNTKTVNIDFNVKQRENKTVDP